MYTALYSKYFMGNILEAGCEGWLGFPDFRSGQKPWWDWYLTLVVNLGEIWMAQLAKSTLLTSTLVHLALFIAKEREWWAESNEKLPHLFILGETATLVPEFAVENLPCAELQPWFLHLQWRTCPWAELQPWFLHLQRRTCPWAEHTDDDDVVTWNFRI